MLLPGSCEIKDDLTSNDEDLGITIAYEETCEFVKDCSGKPRTFSLSIYKTTKGNEVCIIL